MKARAMLPVWLAVAFLPPAACNAANACPDPTADEYFFGRMIELPAREQTRVFESADNRANFTSFDGVEDLRVEDGEVVFTLATAKATLGWGNYLGRQAIDRVADTFQYENVVRLRLRQPADETRWTVRAWCDGQPTESTSRATVSGGDWQEVSFPPLRSEEASPDGLEFTVEGPPGTRVALEWLKLVQRRCEGYCRAEFELPEGKIWRAIAHVGAADHRHWFGRNEITCRLFVNGRPVPRQEPLHPLRTAPVDLRGRLTPGRNCVGFYGRRVVDSPPLYFQATVIMESGQVITVASGRDWKWSPEAAEGWAAAGFDDSAWMEVKLAPGLNLAGRDAGGRLHIPPYAGRMVIQHPGRRDLFYSDAEPVAAEVHLPAGLAAARPTLAYQFGRADGEGHSHGVTEGTLTEFDLRHGDAVFRLDLGRCEHGVYTVAVNLFNAEGRQIDQRPREPLVVLRKLAGKPIRGEDYLEGLDLELEGTIDFTDPDDPHPWIESRAPEQQFGGVADKVAEPRIIRSGPLVYREVTDARRGSGFSYRFEFQRPGSFYVMELEYPDDAKRTIDVVLSTKVEDVWTNSQAGVGVETGGRFLPCGRMNRLRWMHVADPGVHSLDVVNVVNGENAAAARLRIYRVRGDLPSVGAGAERQYGIHSERCFQSSGIGMNFGVGMPRNALSAAKEDGSRPPMQQFVKDLVWMSAAGERYVEYLKFAGQNCHVMGCFQYHDTNTPFVPAWRIDDSRVPHCLKSMMANLFDLNGIDFYAGVEFSNPQNARSYANDAEVARGADTVWMVDAEGRQRYGLGSRNFTMVPNWLHPDVQAAHGQLISSLAHTFGHLRRFRGLHGCLGPSIQAGYWMPGFGRGSEYGQPLAASYDDCTFAQFERDAGVSLPIADGDPRRFQKRAALVQNPALRGRFLAWRCEKLAQLLAGSVDTLRQTRDDLEAVEALWVEDSEFFRYLVSSGKSFDSVMKEFGVDLDRLSQIDGLSLGRWTISWRSGGEPLPSQDPYCWLARTSPEIVSAFESQQRRFVLCRTSWDENLFWAGGHSINDRRDTDRKVEGDWIMNAERTRALPQPGGDHCREAFIQALITGDPELLLGGMTDININVGHEQALRSVLAVYTHLPRERFRPVLKTGLSTNLAIRQLCQPDAAWFYVANPCQWRVSGTVRVRTGGQLVEVPSGRQVAAAASGGVVEVPLRLAPFGLAAFRADSPRLDVLEYRTEPMTADELARLNRMLDRVGDLLAHPQTSLSLAPADRRVIRGTLAAARSAVTEGRYASAWAMITDHRFWAAWKDHLEEAAKQAGPSSPWPRSITYDRDDRVIRLVGFPEDSPATMDDLLAADRAGGWGIVRHNDAADTYYVNAAIWIGDDASDGTFLQIGDRGHPRVTVIVRGTVWVRPPKASTPRSDGLESVINRLTLGDAVEADIRATLKIDCRSPGEHGVYVGHRTPESTIFGGSLRVHNSTITAAVAVAGRRWGSRDYTGGDAPIRWARPGWYATDLRLEGATLSWFEDCPTYGIGTAAAGASSPMQFQPAAHARIERTTFEHGGAAIRNHMHYLKDCVFRDLEVGLGEGGALGAKLVRCTFEDNQANWTLGSLVSRGIVMVDCQVSRQSEPISINKNSVAPAQAASRGVPLYPACAMRRSLRVKVVDAQGQPLPYAWVNVTCPSDPGEVTCGATLTGPDGVTSSDPETGAIIVTVGKYQATDNPDAPRHTAFACTVTAAKPGFRSTTVTLPAALPIPNPLVVTIQPQTAAETPAAN